MLERDDFLLRMAACDVVVALPDPQEGFFLPPLEAMAMDCAVVLPECPGASSYAIDRRTCLTPAFETGAIADAVAELRSDAALTAHIREQGAAIALEHSLARERAEFTDALRDYLAACEAC
jgi:glycosyltransferase involved in cell wall biosynthesis